MTETEYNNAVMAHIQFSLATSKMALDKAADKNVKEFAGFEIEEATAITTVLKDIGTLIQDLDSDNKAAFNAIQSGSEGIDFDKKYIESQLDNHRYLRDLTESYLNSAPTNHLDMDESQSKHLAIMALASFNEHIAVNERISKELSVSSAAPSTKGSL